MRIHSDVLTSNDLYRSLSALNAELCLDAESKGSRKRAHAFEVHLSADRDALHRYRVGTTAETLGDYAATWDEWGVWIDRLLKIDPLAIIGPYDGREDFLAQTSDYINRAKAFQSYKPGSIQARTHTAPWLIAERPADDVELREAAGLPEVA